LEKVSEKEANDGVANYSPPNEMLATSHFGVDEADQNKRINGCYGLIEVGCSMRAPIDHSTWSTYFFDSGKER
jgi:hypothetical protein